MIATVVAGAVLGAVTKNVVALVIKLAQRRYDLWKGFQDDIGFIKTELLMIAGAEEDQLSGKGNPSAVKSISMEEMRDLAQDIEDCLDRILRYAEGEGETSLLHRLKAIGGPAYASEIKKLKKRLKAAYQRKQDYGINGSQPSPAAITPEASSSTFFASTARVEPVGIDTPKKELLELLDDVDGQPEQLIVISIVGFGGSGKSTLARSVYDCPDVFSRFPCRAWVVASEHKEDMKGLLTVLLEQIRQNDRARGDVQQLKADISSYLNTQRYLIVLDDIEEQQWETIKSSFPENTRSRIIVTTTIRPLAELCCNHGNNGYVYNMRTLDEKHSKELLEAVLKRHLPGFEQSSTLIVNKCDGHPLALVSVAHYLLRKREFTETDCKFFWKDLGYHMAKEYAFRNLEQVLMSNYLTLPGCPVNLKTCLLYLCVFPSGHPIRRRSLVRRWFAEGYMQCLDPHTAMLVADQNIEELIDRDIIRAMDPSKNAKAKTCRAHGIMHEFLRHMSMSAKFITSFCNPQRSNYRHLFVEERSNSHSSPIHGDVHVDKKENLRAHSLTICGSAGEAVSYFAKCELVRVLDLEECNDLKDEQTDSIHELWHLRYLSLGDTISRLPKEIDKLYCLETLDVRKTKKAITLPVEVMKLPHLAHLLGKFKLEKKNWKKSKPEKYVTGKSNLQTLAGFVTDDDRGLPMLMIRMKKLQKVKLWCNSAGDELLEAIKEFLRVGMDTSDGDRSLSLDLANSSGNILSSLAGSLENSYGYLSSLKVHGVLSRPTQLVMSLLGLRELCLSSSNLLTISDNELSNMSKLICLEYLKLVKVSLGGLVITKRYFPRLLRLCLVQSPVLPKVEKGALRNLVSLQLLSDDLTDLSGIKIEWHEVLQEVVLDSEVDPGTKTILEDAAKKHPKRPRVLYLGRVDPDEIGSTVKYVAAKRPAPGTRSLIVPVEGQIPAVQSSPVINLEQARVSGPSLASTELCSSRDIEMPSSSRVVSSQT
ncbi:hypothetical protein EJB05_26746, partial [Eragrostis curvula]